MVGPFLAPWQKVDLATLFHDDKKVEEHWYYSPAPQYVLAFCSGVANYVAYIPGQSQLCKVLLLRLIPTYIVYQHLLNATLRKDEVKSEKALFRCVLNLVSLGLMLVT